MRRFLVVLALVVGISPVWSSGAAPSRQYLLHVPPGPAVAGRPLVVVLHGCEESAKDIKAQSGWDELADREGFVVVYPDQLVSVGSSAPLADGNGAGCWNWFLPEDQQRDMGEPGMIADITRTVLSQQQADPSRVYVAGLSAGADMAVILAATYPDLYAAVGSEAGCPYATCTDAAGLLAYRAMGPRARVVPMLVEQGTADTLNPFPQSQALVSSWLGTDDWADDGARNGSVPATPAAVEHHGFDQTPQPGTGDPCVRSLNWPCPGGIVGFQDSYPYTVEHYADGAGCGILDFWIIHGMEHAQPHASSGPFSDPLGPDVTAALWSFFRAHPLGACSSGSPSS